MVEPDYRQYPLNTEACANATSSNWDHPADIVRRWIEICRPEGWARRRFARLICLEPLSLSGERDMTLDFVRVHVSRLGD